MPLTTLCKLITSCWSSVPTKEIFFERAAKEDKELLSAYFSNPKYADSRSFYACALVKYASAPVVAKYVSKHLLHPEAQCELLKRNDPALIDAYLQEFAFTNIEAMKLLFKRKNEAEINLQIIGISNVPWAYLPSEFMRWVLRHGALSSKELLVTKYKLTQETEIALMKTGDTHLIKKYLAEHDICLETARYLVFKKKHSLILLYLQYQKPNAMMIVLLLDRGTHGEIMAMLDTGVRFPDDYMVEKLIKRGNREEIQKFLKQKQLEIEIP